MKPFRSVTARCMPVNLKDVDTDMIIPAEFLTSTSREGYGANLFKSLRENDPQFPLNKKEFQGAEILIADSNFGCGSSREHAVWALQGAGFRAIVGKSFADIFSSNSQKNGFLLATLEPAIVDRLRAEASDGSLTLTVDLEHGVVKTDSGEEFHFDYDPFRKHCLLEGLDDIDYILSKRAEIDSFRKEQEPTRTFSTTTAGAS